MAKVERVLAQQKECYADLGRVMPEVLTNIIDQMKTEEADIVDQAEAKEKELVKAKQRRQEYRASMQVIEQWLNEAEGRLTQSISPTPEEFARHEVIKTYIIGNSIIIDSIF